MCGGGGEGGKHMLGRVVKTWGYFPLPLALQRLARILKCLRKANFLGCKKAHSPVGLFSLAIAEMCHPMIILSKFLLSFPTIGQGSYRQV